MRIGIYTQPLFNNYGGILQNWALQQVLMSLGHDPITIDHSSKYSWLKYFADYSLAIAKRTLGKRCSSPMRPHNGRFGSGLLAPFIHQHINKTRPVNRPCIDLLTEYHINCLVVGSDQIWRPLFNKHLEDSFLAFAKEFDCTKIAYAASFGKDEWEFDEKQSDICTELVKQFDAISVREESGISLCKQHLGVDAEFVLDPTLLLSKEKYSQIIGHTQNNGKFIACYCLDMSQETQSEINNIAKTINLPVRYFAANDKVSLTIGQWLAMFRDASAVITDSFHGTIFSIINQTPFYTLANEVRGASRFHSLLGNLGLLERIVKDSGHLPPPTIDWEIVQKRINQEKQKSISFIQKHL